MFHASQIITTNFIHDLNIEHNIFPINGNVQYSFQSTLQRSDGAPPLWSQEEVQDENNFAPGPDLSCRFPDLSYCSSRSWRYVKTIKIWSLCQSVNFRLKDLRTKVWVNPNIRNVNDTPEIRIRLRNIKQKFYPSPQAQYHFGKSSSVTL